ncbi:galactokinase [Cellvibrio japonicus]|uniref:Galactokinase n=1 Tax=Cellvibrio japonicus (strain Ueda107) TaxID=498211 RepID=B3PJ92_CELJU|nr:galactokinase [Cellvibrio japonicus]ACE83077.1 galactokinase [Cellvibrio japonicus Ueda107]QEI12646.1 galactokinase [Cellvibrio japonicus]QEI16220.1 galactokinase [Cellvibrio japonicus]QEI19798.1 galactokinase [Cellvibrio japonicus]
MTAITDTQINQWFTQAFGNAPLAVVKAPGRVNLIGEHTDYNQGFVLPAAINYYTAIALSPEDHRQITIVAHNFEGERVQIDLDQPMVKDPSTSWPNYVRGVIQQLQQQGFQLAGGKLYIAGDVPAGAGLSSSASLEMALVRALLRLSGESIEPTQAALLGQAAENHFVGCNCGIMDQLISACGQASSALLIDCRDLSTRAVPIPADWELLIVHSGVKRGLVDSEYNQRRHQCEAAAAFFGKTSLRDLNLEELLAAEGQLDDLSFRRARHVLTENQRTLLAADALKRADMLSLAKAMAESHASMRDDFNITTPAIDKLVAILTNAAAGEGGARMTGGGFGGCVVAIAPKQVIPRLMAAVEREYQAATGCEPTLIPARASEGAFA